jgi:predicted ATP-binding protein involved in virulence
MSAQYETLNNLYRALDIAIDDMESALPLLEEILSTMNTIVNTSTDPESVRLAEEKKETFIQIFKKLNHAKKKCSIACYGPY